MRGIVAQFHAGSLIELAYPSIHPSIPAGRVRVSSSRANSCRRRFVWVVCERRPQSALYHARTLRRTYWTRTTAVDETRGDTNFAWLIPKMSLIAIITFSRAITNELCGFRNMCDICIYVYSGGKSGFQYIWFLHSHCNTLQLLLAQVSVAFVSRYYIVRAVSILIYATNALKKM